VWCVCVCVSVCVYVCGVCVCGVCVCVVCVYVCDVCVCERERNDCVVRLVVISSTFFTFVCAPYRKIPFYVR